MILCWKLSRGQAVTPCLKFTYETLERRWFQHFFLPQICLKRELHPFFDDWWFLDQWSSENSLWTSFLFLFHLWFFCLLLQTGGQLELSLPWSLCWSFLLGCASLLMKLKKKEVFDLGADKSLGLDDFSLLFYQYSWTLAEKDLLRFFFWSF